MAVFLYYGEFSHFSHPENWIAAALDRNGHHCVRMERWHDIHADAMATHIIRMIRGHHAQFLLLTKVPELQAAHLELIKKETGARIIMWTFDWMKDLRNWSWYEPQAKVADLCFQTDGYAEQEEYDRLGIRRIELHQACEPRLHDWSMESAHLPRQGTALYGHDVIFIGSTYTERRKELLKELGHGRYDFWKWGNPEPMVWGNEFAATVYLSKIVIGDNYVNDVAGYWSDRVYLTLACGGFFLTAYVHGLEREFENHRHLVWWSDFDEMHRMIDYYLPREAERRAIALEGYRLVHKEHTYDRRIQRMTEELAKDYR